MDIDKLMCSMTIEEKIGLLVGGGYSKLVPGAAGETRGIERLEIPFIVLADGPAGVRIHPFRFNDPNTYYVTAFPNEIVLASTWNPDLVEKVGRAIGEEAKEYGIDVHLAPGINIHRTPLGGRIFEYFSEDPFLTGVMAAAYVRGIQSTGVGATLKHFVCNDQETNRMKIDIIVSERALREIYLRPFEIAIGISNPWAVMASYNKLNGEYSTQNAWLLTRVLREEWGYRGLVMTDWYAGEDPVKQIKAGVDLIMPGDNGVLETLIEAYKRGELDEETVNKRVRKVLELIAKTMKSKEYTPSNRPQLEEHAKIAYEAAVEGVVLLKNNDVLPVKKGSKIALFGRGSYYTIKGGLGSGETYPKYVVSISSGLRENGLEVDENVEKVYKDILGKYLWWGLDPLNLLENMGSKYIREGKISEFLYLYRFLIGSIELYRTMMLTEEVVSDDLIEKAACNNDLAIITISRISGEGYDRYPYKGDFYLRKDEYSLITRVSKVFHKYGKRVVVLLNVPGPVEVASWRELVDALLVIWLPGQEAGRAVADILLGRVTPSGKLPLTWPMELYENPATKTFPILSTRTPERLAYEEDIYVGYRYYDTFYVQPAYEFGYGLSYTIFKYKALETEHTEEGIVVRVTIGNVGNYPGKEVVQVYIRAPRGEINKPFQELKGFKKTNLLRPGDEERVEITIPVRYLASFNGKKWVVERGLYEIRVGSSSRDIRLISEISIEKEICYDKSWKLTEC